MHTDFGRPGISPRTMLGAMIIKHMEKLDDRSVIGNTTDNDGKTGSSKQDNAPSGATDSEGGLSILNKGKLQLDATVSDQYITYPTDTKLLNVSCKQCEVLIDIYYLKINEF